MIGCGRFCFTRVNKIALAKFVYEQLSVLFVSFLLILPQVCSPCCKECVCEKNELCVVGARA